MDRRLENAPCVEKHHLVETDDLNNYTLRRTLSTVPDRRLSVGIDQIVLLCPIVSCHDTPVVITAIDSPGCRQFLAGNFRDEQWNRLLNWFTKLLSACEFG